MSWTYLGCPGTDTADERRDAVRLYVGDTDKDDQQVQDAEIDFALSEKDDEIYAASAMVCRILAGKYTRLVDISIDGVSTSYSDRADSYTALAEKYEQEASLTGGGLGSPYVGGVSKAERDSVDEETDRIKPAFERGQFDNPSKSDTDERLSSD